MQRSSTFFPTVVVLLFLSCCLAAAPAARAAADDSPAASTLQNHAEAMQRGQEALNAGNNEQAYEIFSGLLREYPQDDDVNFGLGQAAFAMGRYPHALLAYQRVLNRHPEADRVRLETARTYTAMEQYNQARREYETVLSHNPPEPVRANIEQSLAALDAGQRTWSLSPFVSAGVFYDSNVNSGLSTVTASLDNATLNVPVESRSHGDWGRFLAGGLRYDQILGEDGKWLLSANGQIYQRWNNIHDQSDITDSRIEATIQHIFDNDSLASLQTRYENVQYGYDNLVDIYGLSPSYIYPLTSWMQLITRVDLELRDYALDIEKSTYTALTEDLRILIGQAGHEITVGGSIFAEDAKSTQYSNTGYELSVRPVVHLGWDTDLYGRALFRQTDYHAPVALMNERRSDSQERYLLGLRRPFWLPGLSADLNVEYTHNDSNTAIYDFERTVVTFGLTYAR